MNKEKVSIIIPIYNGEKYLVECLNTVINQTYSNIEIILVNDGSTDNTAEICDSFRRRDARCKIIRQKNRGVTHARKAGLIIATGTYIFFVDCDDWLEKNAVKSLVVEARKQDADIVVSGYIEERGGENSSVIYGKMKEGIYDGKKEKFYDSMFYLGAVECWGILPSLWAKLFKRELLVYSLEQVDERIIYGEDAAIVFCTCLSAKRIAVMKKAFYHYRYFSTTSVSRKRNKFLLDNMYYLHEYFYSLFKKQKNSEQLLEQLRYYMVNIMNHSGSILFNAPYHLQESEWLRPEVEKWKHQYYELCDSYNEVQQKYQALEEALNKWIMPINLVGKKKRIVLYGAGKNGKIYHNLFSKRDDIEIVAWVDKDLHKDANLVGVESIKNYDYDFVLISVLDVSVKKEISNELMKYGVDKQKIFWVESVS